MHSAPDRTRATSGALESPRAKGIVVAVLLLTLVLFTVRFLPNAFAATTTYEAESAARTTTGTYGIEIISAGSGTFSTVVVTGAPSGGLSVTGGFTVNRGAGNSGW